MRRVSDEFSLGLLDHLESQRRCKPLVDDTDGAVERQRKHGSNQSAPEHRIGFISGLEVDATSA
jgi:hypothetical protein